MAIQTLKINYKAQK